MLSALNKFLALSLYHNECAPGPVGPWQLFCSDARLAHTMVMISAM